MKIISLIFIIALISLSTHGHSQQIERTDEAMIQKLQQQLQTLHPNFINNFISFYHIDMEDENNLNQKTILNHTRVSLKKSTYLLLVAKMYLYRMLPNQKFPELRYYNTESNYMAIYYYLRVAAEIHENEEAYYLLGILQQFKLVPDIVIAKNIQSLQNRNQQQEILLKYLQQSHLYNAQSALFMSSALGFHPASLSLGYMNRNKKGTSKNCTTSLAYYLSVIKATYIQSYFFRQVYSFDDSLEDKLYSKKRLLLQHQRVMDNNHFIQDTEYYDDQIIQATSHLADNYYMGSGGYLRNLTRAAKLYEKLALGGSRYGKIMSGICYFKGEGVPVNRVKAQNYFLQTAKDEVSEYMLISINYFEIIDKGTKQIALLSMLRKYKSWKNKERLGSHLNYLIGSVILKGQLKDKDKDGKQIVIPESEGYLLLDTAAAQGNTQAKVLLGILFSDGVTGLKYGCEEATKYFSQQALAFPYFMSRASTALYALTRGQRSFSLIKYLELALVGYQNAYINILYLLELYGYEVLGMSKDSWSVKHFKSNQIYKELFNPNQVYSYFSDSNVLVDVESYILKLYTVKGKSALNLNNLDNFLTLTEKTAQQFHAYIRKKVITWGSAFDKKNILKYYQYLLAEEQNSNTVPLLTSLASGDSSKLYVCQARYLLGKYHHQRALQTKPTLTPHQHFRIIGQYNRAVKSQLIGLIIFHIEEYLLGSVTTFSFFQSEVGEDLMAYIFVLAILAFVLYYLRSKRIDQFHKNQLEKQLRKAAQQRQIERLAEDPRQIEHKLPNLEERGGSKMIEEVDRDQPTIIQDEQPLGVRIGSSLED